MTQARSITDDRLILGLFVLFGVEWIALAISPLNRQDWALENALVVILLGAALASLRWFRLSRTSYVLLFTFACLHEIGAHYTYSEVPYDAWWTALTGYSFNAMVGWQRNNFDRIIHFLFGLLLTYPAYDIVIRATRVTRAWARFFAITIILTGSMSFELFEWWAAELFGGDLGVAYLGTQGDVWDAQKDMLLAVVGALIAAGATLVAEFLRRRRASAQM